MRIRKLTSDRIGALLTMLSRVEATFRPFPITNEGIRQAADDRDEHWLIVSPTGDVLAYGMLRGWAAGFEVPALGIAVDPFHRRRGLATAMILFLHHRAAERGAKAVMLHVDDANTSAQRLYLMLGYRPAEDRWVCRL